MKTSSKPTALTIVLVAVMVLFSVSAYAQSPVSDVKPTFITLTPGLYVHGWPTFTVSYPKEWVVLPTQPGAFFRAGVSRQDLPASPVITISVSTSILPLEDWAKMYMPVYSQVGTDIKVLSDKPSQLKDGASTKEVELEFVSKNGPKMNHFLLMTKKGLTWISITLSTDKGKIGEDLKSYAYSLTFQPGREEPVKVPPDVQAFLDKYCSDIVSGDVERIMSNYSDQFLHRGQKKSVFEQWFRNDPNAPTKRSAISSEATVIVFEPQGDKAYVDGFFLSKAKGDTDAMAYQQIIKESGQWKWYGNQK
jgi:hypothetical protein